MIIKTTKFYSGLTTAKDISVGTIFTSANNQEDIYMRVDPKSPYTNVKGTFDCSIPVVCLTSGFITNFDERVPIIVWEQSDNYYLTRKL